MYHILIIEDDAALSNGITLALRDSRFAFRQAFNLSEAGTLLKSEQVDLIILDVNLPDGSGLELLKKLRISSSVPVIILTANDLETDIVTGLEYGADDYVTKPFSLMVLRAKVNARIRLLEHTVSLSKEIRIDGFCFDFQTMQFYKNGAGIELSKTEQKLLRLLLENRGITVSRSGLVDKIWTDGAEYVDENALSVTIKRLRDKLEDNPSAPEYIKTVYGIGYTWVVN
jgi:DNA-binding response OmpR family regulator